FMSERWRIEPEYAIKVDSTLGILGVLLEPASVISKAIEQIAMIGRRSFWEPRTVLVTGAGPIGLLAALSVKLMGFEVHVLDKVETGVKPDLIRELGATYHAGSMANVPFEPDAIIECTGVGQLVSDCIEKIGANGIICLTGIGHGGSVTKSGTGAVAAAAVLRNNVIVGSVNANKRHWYKAAQMLACADRKWLSKLITRREKPENFMTALNRKPDDIKVVIQFSEV
ncbi:MAG TPA: zinc-binding dehydrogenase, partial [Chryseolinea sp.]|nr:zinc-binding dehydrogenase [Chryseolinea sp.]